MKRSKRFIAVTLAFIGVLAAGIAHVPRAHAALSPSERDQVRGFVAGAHVKDAARARALVARTDLSDDEVTSVLRDALAPLPFTDERAAFVRELLFGGASLGARPALVPPLTRAILARADALYEKHGAELENDRIAVDELVRVYAFLDATIASAGKPVGPAHDPTAGISDAAYDSAFKAMALHIGAHGPVLKSGEPLGPVLSRLRAQAHLTLIDFAGESKTRAFDLTQTLGYNGARRAIATDLGILLVDNGRADDARITRFRSLLERAPAAIAKGGVIVALEGASAFVTRSPLIVLRGGLDGFSTGRSPTLGDDVEPSTIDPQWFARAYDLADAAVHHTFAVRNDLRTRSETDARAVGTDPRRTLGILDPRSVPTVAVNTAVALLLVDAQRAIDLAFVRGAAAHFETAALLSDAVGVLAAGAFNESGTLRAKFGAGRDDGTSETAAASQIKLASDGAALAFQYGGHKWEINRDETGRVLSLAIDGRPPSLASLPSARLPVSDGPNWQEGTLIFAKVSGAPRAGTTPGPNLRVVGTSQDRNDAIGFRANALDVTLEAILRSDGPDAAIYARAASVKGQLRGAALVVRPGGRPRVALTAHLDDGSEVAIAPETELPPRPNYAVKIIVRGLNIDATISGTSLRGTLPSDLGTGDFAVVAKRGTSIELDRLRLSPVRK